MAAPIAIETAYERLLALGAGEISHVAGTLALHLRRTEALLRRFGNRDALCAAGLYHAVYSTAGFPAALCAVAARRTIADAIGDEAERIVYLYGACDRTAFHPRIGTAREARFVDRFTASEYPISRQELRDFCELTLANELDLVTASPAFCGAHRTHLVGWFERIRSLLSDTALDAFRTALDRYELDRAAGG
jgi:uncharacterized protein DUF6817